MTVLVVATSGIEDLKEFSSVYKIKGLFKVYKHEKILSFLAMAMKFLQGECNVRCCALACLEAALVSLGHQQMTMRVGL